MKKKKATKNIIFTFDGIVLQTCQCFQNLVSMFVWLQRNELDGAGELILKTIGFGIIFV